MEKIKNRLNFKIPLLITIGVLIPLILFTSLFYYQVRKIFILEKMGDMMNLNDTKFIHVLDFIDIVKGEIRESTENEATKNKLLTLQKTGDPKIPAEMQKELNRDVKYLSLTHKESFGRPVPTRKRFDEFMLLNPKGVVIASSNKRHIGQNLRNSAYYTTKKIKFIDAHREKGGKVVFGYAGAVKKGDKLLGVAVGKINVKYLTMLVTGELGNVTGGKLFFAGFRPTLDLYVINRHGVMITQSRLTKKNTVLSRRGNPEALRRLLKTRLTGDYTTNIGAKTGAREAMGIYKSAKGLPVAATSMPVFDNMWSVVVEQRTYEAFAPIIRTRNLLIFGVLAVALMTILLSFILINKSVIEPIARLNEFAGEITAGDLNNRVELKQQDELGRLARALNEMADTLSQTIEAEQRHQENLREMVAKYKNTVAQTKHQAEVVVEAALRTENISGSGNSIIRETITNMDEIEAGTKTVAAQSRELSNQARLISNIIATVNSITEQSNILAINASIEAAKAGEHGESFAVVAEEIKNMADASQQSTANIEKILKKIENSIAAMADASQNSSDIAVQGKKLADQAGGIVNSLSEAIKTSAVTAKRILDFAAKIESETGTTDGEKRAANF